MLPTVFLLLAIAPAESHDLPAVSVEADSARATTRNGRLYCWGGGYPTANRPSSSEVQRQPTPPPVPHAVSIDTPVGRQAWGPSCAINRPCELVAQAIPACPAGTKGITAAEAAALPADGRIISVQGNLFLADIRPVTLNRLTCVENDPRTGKPLPVVACCHGKVLSAFVDDQNVTENAIPIDGPSCAGDESRVCCDIPVPVAGQTVVATGKWLPAKNAFHRRASAMLASGTELCRLGSP